MNTKRHPPPRIDERWQGGSYSDPLINIRSTPTEGKSNMNSEFSQNCEFGIDSQVVLS